MKLVNGVISLFLISGSAFAHIDYCDLSMEKHIEVSPKSISFYDDDDDEILRINAKHDLFIHGKSIDLTDEEKELTEEYSKAVRLAVEDLSEIVVMSVDIGMTAAENSLRIIFDNDKKEFTELNVAIQDMLNEIKQQMSKEHFSTRQLEKAFEENDKFEEAIEQAVEKIAERPFKALGLVMDAVFNNAKEIEKRAERIEQEVETVVEAKSDLIKKKAKSLCKKLQTLDRLETKLAEQNNKLSEFDIIESENGSDCTFFNIGAI